MSEPRGTASWPELPGSAPGEPELWERYPNIRAGEVRAPLREGLRELVLARDRYRCKHCDRAGELQIDHIVPWSAGGSDKTTNLRTLCTPCNQRKSNFRYWESPRELPIGIDCDRCRVQVEGGDWGSPVQQAGMWCAACRQSSITSEPWRLI